MIYTLTLNPAIDYFMGFDGSLEKHQKTGNFKMLPGGKGINASIILQELDIPNQTIVITGGMIGQQLLNILKKYNLDIINIDSQVDTRINNKINFQGTTYEMNSSGNNIDSKLINDNLLTLLETTFQPGDMLMIMGSYPPGYTFKDLEKIVKSFYKKKIKLVFDLAKDDLLKLAKYEPEIIKPNKKELSIIFNQEITSKEEALIYAQKFQQKGAKRVLVSFDKSGSIYFDLQTSAFIKGIQIEEINGSGAGDSMLAGFVAGLEQKLNIIDTLKLSAGAGTATAASEGVATKTKIKFYQDQIKVQTIKEKKCK